MFLVKKQISYLSLILFKPLFYLALKSVPRVCGMLFRVLIFDVSHIVVICYMSSNVLFM